MKACATSSKQLKMDASARSSSGTTPCKWEYIFTLHASTKPTTTTAASNGGRTFKMSNYKLGDTVKYYDYDASRYFSGEVIEIHEGYQDGDIDGERYYPEAITVKHQYGSQYIVTEGECGWQACEIVKRHQYAAKHNEHSDLTAEDMSNRIYAENAAADAGHYG